MEPGLPLKQRAVEALAAHREAPEELGYALRALRLLIDIGGEDVAREVACAFVRLHDGDERAGDAVLAFARQAPEARFEPGCALTEEGEIDARVFVVMGGEVVVRRLGVGELNRLGPGATVGEIAGVAGTARTASIYARTAVTTLCIPGRALSQLREHFPATTDLVARHARQRLLAQLIPVSSPFNEMPEPEQEALFDQLTARTVPKGTAVLREGEPAPGLFLIVAGHAQTSQGAGPNARHLMQLGPGDVFGAVSLIFDRGATADVVAVTPLTVFVLAPDDFRLLLLAHRPVASRLIDLARRRLRESGTESGPLTSWLRGAVGPSLSHQPTAITIAQAPAVPMRGATAAASRSVDPPKRR